MLLHSCMHAWWYKIVKMKIIYNIKFHQISCYSHDNKTLTAKSFLFINFHYRVISPRPMVMHWNENYEENEMIKVGQT